MPHEPWAKLHHGAGGPDALVKYFLSINELAMMKVIHACANVSFLVISAKQTKSVLHSLYWYVGLMGVHIWLPENILRPITTLDGFGWRVGTPRNWVATSCKQ